MLPLPRDCLTTERLTIAALQTSLAEALRYNRELKEECFRTLLDLEEACRQQPAKKLDLEKLKEKVLKALLK